MTGSPPAEVELVLDVCGLRTPPGSAQEFVALWNQVEPALAGRDLRAKQIHQLDGADGAVRLEVARLADGISVVSHTTQFSIIAVREPSRLRYRCKQCADEGVECYGPFLCSAARPEDPEHRTCDQHVSILDGALTPTCAEHRPACGECGRPATFRCAGYECRRNHAWCDQHRRPHPRDRDVDYCPSCYHTEFPRCEAAGCVYIRTVTCEQISPTFKPSGCRAVTRHAHPLQLICREPQGVGPGSGHARVNELPPEQLVFQIVVGATARRRRERLPSLQGFAHTLRNTGHQQLALDYQGIRRTLANVAAAMGSASPKSAIDSMREMQPVWDKQLTSTAIAADDGRRLVDDLKRIVLAEDPRYGTALAAALTLAAYKPAVVRNGQVTRQARLFVNVPENLRGLFIGAGGARKRRYAELLGVEVSIEGGKRRR